MVTIAGHKVMPGSPAWPLKTAVMCPYCKDLIENGCFLTCPACTTPHHLACWKGHGRCSVFGCTGVDAPSSGTRRTLTLAARAFVGSIVAGFILLLLPSLLNHPYDDIAEEMLPAFGLSLLGAFVLSYALLASACVRAAAELREDAFLYAAFFAILPVTLYFFWTVAPLLALLSPGMLIAVYLHLSHELAEQAQDLSLFPHR